MQELSAILLDLFVIFAAAKVAGELFERLRQPAVVGEILVGVIIGPHVLGWIGEPGFGLIELFHGDRAAADEALTIVYDVLSEIGIVVLLFYVGLETPLSDILRVGNRAAAVAMAGIVVPFVLGTAFIALLGEPRTEALFVGTAMVATSIGITARVLRDLNVLRSREARTILGAAAIDDILGIILLTVVVGTAEGGKVDALEVGLVALQAIAFTGFVAFLGTHAARRYSLHLTRLRLPNAPFAVAMALMLGLAALAGELELAGIIGAFLAGMVLAESRERFALEEQTRPVYEFLTPFFFVIVGSRVDIGVFREGDIMAIAAGVTALAVAGKLVACGLGGLGWGARSMGIIGLGMVPRGEVGLIVASLGRSLGVIPDDMFSVVVIMSIATTIIVPPMLAPMFRGRAPAGRARAAVERRRRGR